MKEAVMLFLDQEHQQTNLYILRIEFVNYYRVL